MSLYNNLFGTNEYTDQLLDILNLEQRDFGRFRDIHLTLDKKHIEVLTRIGGINRDDYPEVFKNLSEHRYFEKEEDDPYDSTYCIFTFKIPDILQEEASKYFTAKDGMTVKELFDKEMKEMEDPNSEAAKRAEIIVEKIQKGIEENPNGGIIWM